MKQFFSSLLLSAVLYSGISVAQNIPDGSILPGSSANIVLPSDYNAGSNTAPTSFNYTSTWAPIRASQSFSPTSVLFVSKSTTYTNGFGQPLQSVTPVISHNDIVTVQDNRAMLNKPAYLPFAYTPLAGFQANGFSNQKDWYTANFPNEGDNAYSRSEQVAAGSQHSGTSYAAGASFTGSGRGTTSSAEANTIFDQIAILTDVPGGYPSYSADYTNGELIKKKTTGQHDALAYEFVNRSGQLICKQVDDGNSMVTTYYVYDELGHITWILPPKAVSTLQYTVWAGASVYDALCYHYIYNDYGEVVERAIPDKQGREYKVYDSKHRPVLSQTPLLKTQNKWAFQIYDSRSRVVCSGFVNSNRSRQVWQSMLDPLNGGYAAGSLEDYLQHECNGAYPASIVDCELNQFNYYDNYNFDQLLPLFNRTFSNIHNGDYVISDLMATPQPASFVRGLLTATRTRVLSTATAPNPFTGDWTSTVIFYDKDNRPIQTQTQYPWNTASEWDIASTQYTFRGQVAMTALSHNTRAGGTKTGITKMLVKRTYEAGGLCRLRTVTESMDGGTPVQLSLYDYDDLGRVKTKSIGNGLEKQNYTYNIRGQLTGINAGYLQDPTWPDATFGCALSYDYGFSSPRYDGAIAGMQWRGAGSGSDPRAYGYQYDRAGRMTGADFNHLPGLQLLTSTTQTWQNADLDYSVSNISYDENGNMQSMRQRGMVPGVSTPGTIDDLSYNYKSNSNQLDEVKDNIPDQPSVNSSWQLGDFVDGNANNGSDYDYDADGNLVMDRNKGIASITYNAQDLPLEVTNASGYKVVNIYDAAGTLLQKTITNGNIFIKQNTYCGPLVYDGRELSYALNEEGRVRWVKDTAVWRYDYFVKDHLGNVRTIITGDHPLVTNYLATHELQMVEAENKSFDLGNMVPKPGSTDPNDLTAVEMNGSDATKRIGTSLMLKVMAGDKFDATVSTYYDPKDVPTGDGCTGADMLGSLIGSLTGGITELGSSEGMGDYQIGSMLGGDDMANAYNDLLDNNTDPDQPKAYLNWAMFDEDMHIIPEQSGVKQVTSCSSGAWATLATDNTITASKNGYLIAWMSNLDAHTVFMDNLKVTYSQGRLLEEQHYYPHGLVIKNGAHTPLANRYLYQGMEYQNENDAGLQLYDFHARQYDAQLGRFASIDPMSQFPSGYTGMGNDPANMIDPTGCLIKGAVNQGTTGGQVSGRGPTYQQAWFGTEDAGGNSNAFWSWFTSQSNNSTGGSSCSTCTIGQGKENSQPDHTIYDRHGRAVGYNMVWTDVTPGAMVPGFIPGTMMQDYTITNHSQYFSIGADENEEKPESAFGNTIKYTQTTSVGEINSGFGDQLKVERYTNVKTGTEGRVATINTEFENGKAQSVELEIGALGIGYDEEVGLKGTVNMLNFSLSATLRASEGFTIGGDIYNGKNGATGMQVTFKPGLVFYGAQAVQFLNLLFAPAALLVP